MTNQKTRQTLNDWKHSKSLLFAELTTVTNNFMTKQSFLWILQYNIRKSLKIQKSFLINREVRDFDIVVIQKQNCNINDMQSFNSAHNFFYLVKNTSLQSRTCIYVNKCLKLDQWVIETAESVDWSSSWVSSWHFELESILSQVTHIFNLIQVKLLIFSTWHDLTRLEIESTQLNSSRTWTECQKR